MDTDVAAVIAMAEADISDVWSTHTADRRGVDARYEAALEAAREARYAYQRAQPDPLAYHAEAFAAENAANYAAEQRRDRERESLLDDRARHRRATIQAARSLIGDAADRICGNHTPIFRLDPMPAEAVDLFVRHGVDDGLTVTISDAAIAARVKRLIMGRLTDDGRDGFRQIGGCRWAAGIFDHVVLQDSKVRFGTSTGGSVCIVGHSPVVSVAIPGVDFDRITYRAQQAGTIPAVTA